MNQQQIMTDKAPVAIGPYSQGIQTGDFIFVSGQIPLDPKSGVLVEGGVEMQTVRALENVGAVLAAEGLGFQDVVKTTIFLRDMADFASVNSLYETYFSAPYPARSCVAVAGLPRNARVEIEVIAVRK